MFPGWGSPRVSALAGEKTISATKPDIPHETIQSWQRIVDLIADIADVPASLVMRTNAPHHAVFVSNDPENTPYKIGLQFRLHDKLYCQGVLKHGELVVEDATCDPDWADNDDMEHGMSFYAGYPLHWPDNSVFGTICVLDQKRNPKALLFLEGLKEFARVIEADLKLLVEAEHRARLERKLQDSLDQLENRVEERTAELEEANIALRVLLESVENSKDEYERKVARKIKGLVAPVVAKLRGRLRGNADANLYLDVLEDNLGSITSSMSDRLTEVIRDLTPTEQEIALLIMRGQTTKDIARALSREPSTVEFHRNNIRKKLGLRKSGQNLRNKLQSMK